MQGEFCLYFLGVPPSSGLCVPSDAVPCLLTAPMKERTRANTGVKFRYFWESWWSFELQMRMKRSAFTARPKRVKSHQKRERLIQGQGCFRKTRSSSCSHTSPVTICTEPERKVCVKCVHCLPPCIWVQKMTTEEGVSLKGTHTFSGPSKWCTAQLLEHWNEQFSKTPWLWSLYF